MAYDYNQLPIGTISATCSTIETTVNSTYPKSARNRQLSSLRRHRISHIYNVAHILLLLALGMVSQIALQAIDPAYRASRKAWQVISHQPTRPPIAPDDSVGWTTRINPRPMPPVLAASRKRKRMTLTSRSRSVKVRQTKRVAMDSLVVRWRKATRTAPPQMKLRIRCFRRARRNTSC